MSVWRPAAILPALLLLGACAAVDPRFSTEDAAAHVEMLAGVVGSRWVGTEANQRARSYIVEQLGRSGFEVRIQEADASRPEHGVTARVANIIGTKPGRKPAAIALVSHYDSVPESPGAADAALGVAVALEAGRVLAAVPDRAHTLVVALTDAEEVGLMGAAALVTDPVFQAVRAYLNFEAVGTTGPPMLFETGPGNSWIVEAWARSVPHPAGTSFAREIYKALPNDTDFSILKRTGAVGLNFAPTGNSHAYHTKNDRPAALSRRTLEEMGRNAVAAAEALDRLDLERRSTEESVYFAVEGAAAFAFSPAVAESLLALAAALGIVAWVRLLASLWRADGALSTLMAVLEELASLAAFVGAMLAAAWAVRATSAFYHPWYARPWLFFALLVAAGLLGSRIVTHLSTALLPVRFTGTPHPAGRWAVAFPAWILIAGAAWFYAPGASYLATVPLLVASIAALGVPPRSGTAVRIASVIALAAAGAVCIRPAAMLLGFAVPAFGRIPVVTPFYVYPALLAAAALFVGPPLAAIAVRGSDVAGTGRRRLWPRTVTLASVLGASWALLLLGDAYTSARPELREANYYHDVATRRAFWEVGGREPGTGVRDISGAPAGWVRVSDALLASAPVGRTTGGPFVHRAPAAPLATPPANVQATLRQQGTEDAVLEVTVYPREPGLAVTLHLPRGVNPIDSNLAGADRGSGWRATYVAPPPEGVRFTLRVPSASVPLISAARVVVRTSGLPDGTGPQRLLPWLEQERTAWTARSVFVLPLTGLDSSSGPSNED
ncbi:MAG: M28 family peptidase [Vicinamibacterales bacterium]